MQFTQYSSYKQLDTVVHYIFYRISTAEQLSVNMGFLHSELIWKTIAYCGLIATIEISLIVVLTR